MYFLSHLRLIRLCNWLSRGLQTNKTDFSFYYLFFHVSLCRTFAYLCIDAPRSCPPTVWRRARPTISTASATETATFSSSRAWPSERGPNVLMQRPDAETNEYRHGYSDRGLAKASRSLQQITVLRTNCVQPGGTCSTMSCINIYQKQYNRVARFKINQSSSFDCFLSFCGFSLLLASAAPVLVVS